MIVDWPSDLPTTVITDGYEERPPNSIRRTPMDAGPPKRRRRGSSMTRPMTLTVKGTALTTAAIGEPVDVLNSVTKKILHGVARADGSRRHG